MRKVLWVFLSILLMTVMILGTTSTDVEKLIEKCRAGKAGACKKLAKIAKSKKEKWEVIKAAIIGLSDQHILADIAQNSSIPRQILAVNNQYLTDQVVLAQIASNEQNLEVACAALDKLKDQRALGETAKSKARWRIVVFAARRLTDQEVLEDVAQKAIHYEARRTAVWKVKNQELLTEIALKEDSESVARAAAGSPNLVDQRLLEKIGREANHVAARISAINKLTHIPLLKEISKNAKIKKIRESAETRIKTLSTIAEAKNPEDLKYLLKNGTLEVQKMVMDKLTDQKIIAEFAKSHSLQSAWYALSKITDPKLINDIALNAIHFDTKLEAIKRVTDGVTLAKIAKSDESRLIRFDALKNPHFNDQKTIIDIALNDKESFVRKAAVSSPILKDQAVLMKISQFEIDDETRNEAIKKLSPDNRHSILPWIDADAVVKITDQNLLDKIALTAGDPKIRVAVAKILQKNPDLSKVQNIQTVRINTYGEMDKGTAYRDKFKNAAEMESFVQKILLQPGIRIIPDADQADGTLTIVIGSHKTSGKTVSGVEKTINMSTGRVVSSRPTSWSSKTGHSMKGAVIITVNKHIIYAKPFAKSSGNSSENLLSKSLEEIATELWNIKKQQKRTPEEEVVLENKGIAIAKEIFSALDDGLAELDGILKDKDTYAELDEVMNGKPESNTVRPKVGIFMLKLISKIQALNKEHLDLQLSDLTAFEACNRYLEENHPQYLVKVDQLLKKYESSFSSLGDYGKKFREFLSKSLVSLLDLVKKEKGRF